MKAQRAAGFLRKLAGKSFYVLRTPEELLEERITYLPELENFFQEEVFRAALNYIESGKRGDIVEQTMEMAKKEITERLGPALERERERLQPEWEEKLRTTTLNTPEQVRKYIRNRRPDFTEEQVDDYVARVYARTAKE